MLDRDTLVDLGFAIILFLLALSIYVIPERYVAGPVLVLTLYPLARFLQSQGWALLDGVFAVWLVVLATTVWFAPAWGIPLLVVTAGLALVQALGELGIIIDLALVAFISYISDAPLWAVGLVLLAALWKLIYLLRDYWQTPTTSNSEAH